MKKFLSIPFLFILCISLYSSSIWRDRNVYSSAADPAVGDIIVVNVRDLSKFKFEVKLSSSSSADIITNPDITITGFLPGVSANRSFSSNDSTSFAGISDMDFPVSATVTARQVNGNAVISGTRSYVFNGISTTVSISGIVDPSLIDSGTVSSRDVANFSIQITSRKEGVAVTPAEQTEDAPLSVQLSDEDKQRIIRDYLEKIIGELTR